jgi:transketolase
MYSIIPFVTMRGFEQIRNDICYQNLDVKMVGVGAGFSYGSLGSTHYAIEDISILRSLPNITILSPADPIETKELMLQAYKKPGPAYMRINKPKSVAVGSNHAAVLSKPSVITRGKDGIIIATGVCVQTGFAVIKKLKEQGIQLGLISLHTLKPIDEKALQKELKGKKYIFTLEEHRVVGGLGSAVAEIMVKSRLNNVVVTSIGVDDTYSGIVGHQDHLVAHYGIDEKSVYQKIIKVVKKDGK